MASEENTVGDIAVPLTNEELVFPDFNRYQWCVSAPFTEDQLRKIGPDTLNVCVHMELSVEQYTQIANAMVKAPKATLRVEGANCAGFQGTDLYFLKYFGHVRRISLSRGAFTDLSGLLSLSRDVVQLELDLRSSQTKPSLEVLNHFKSLQALRIVGHYEDLSRFPNLVSLRALLLSAVKLKDLRSLSVLRNLQSLAVADSKVQDISHLPNIGRLKYLGLARLPTIGSVQEIENLQNLEYLQLLVLNKVESLPSLQRLSNLRRLSLVGLKRLVDLSGIADAPRLEELLLFDMKHLKPHDLEALAGHPALKALRTDDLEIEQALGLPRGGTGRVFEFSESTESIFVEPAPPAEEAVERIAPEALPASDNDADSSQECKIREELRVHIKIGSDFGGQQEWLECNEIEDRLEEILVADLLGRWDGQEIGAGFYTIFFVGENCASMFAELESELEMLLPNGSYVELEDAARGTKVVNY